MTALRFTPVGSMVTQGTIDDYAVLSGDHNPLHVDHAAAAASEFGGTIAHGPIAFQSLLRSLTSGLGVEALPAGTTLKVTYRAPVRPGDTVTSQLHDAGEQPQVGHALDAACVNQDGVTVISGTVTLPGGA
jgi:acyl dehydratase